MVYRAYVVHGIATPKGYPFATECEKALSKSKITVHATCGCWDSSGEVVPDIRLTITDRMWREKQIETVAEDLTNFAAVVEARPDVTAVLIGHSMGSVFLNEAERRLRTGIPLVYIGSPFSHPIWKQAFRAIRLYRKPGQRPKLFYNYDDDVSSSRVFSRGVALPPRWTDAVRVAEAGKGAFVEEHGHVGYLENANVARCIRTILHPSSTESRGGRELVP